MTDDAAKSSKWRELTAAAMHPGLLTRFGVRLRQGDGKRLAELLPAELSQREIRRLVFALLSDEPLQLTCERDGFTWLIDNGDEVGEHIFVDGRYEGEEIEAVLAYLKGNNKSTVIEVGANIGTTALPIARYGYQVVAIEPVPPTFAMLSRNVQANGLADSIRCVNRAVTTTAGHIDMWITKGSGLSEVAVGDRDPVFSEIEGSFQKHRVTVESSPLDELLKTECVTVEDIALVWSDAQGSETYVIETGRDLWDAGVALYAEVEPSMLSLHGGVDAFIDKVQSSFRRFLTRDALIARGAPQDIGGFRAFTQTLTGLEFSDVLLIP
jgi:FkbM family methyltransferase